MKKYIGCKLVEAEPAVKIGKEIYPLTGDVPKALGRKMGYKVRYADGYESWSPKEVFEKAYMEVGENNTITQKNVDDFIAKTEVITMGEKTTVVRATLVNGFELVESSACVSKDNYDESIGAEICKGRIKDKVWGYLRFLLQTAVGGVKNEGTEKTGRC